MAHATTVSLQTTDTAGVALHGVSRVFEIPGQEPIKALDSVTLRLQPGSATALMGPSGSGKSTLLYVIGGLDQVGEGTVHVNGQELGFMSRRRLAAHRRNVGFVFQRFNLLPALTVLDNILAPVLPYRVEFDAEARARELVDAVGLGGREHSLPSRLSGGQQQRIAIARALIYRPPVILADEPTGNLDSRTGREVIELLHGLRRQHGLTLVLATHDQEVAMTCERVVELQDGRIVGDRAAPHTGVSDG